MKLNHIDYSKVSILHPITTAYINDKPELSDLYQFKPTPEGLNAALNERENFPINRINLVEALKNQYGKSASEEQEKLIDSLKEANTYTVVTGHQLNLFTGPLYFVYKIFSVIKMAEKLNANHPDKRIIPVYWMATEDHDFDEINHFHLAHKAFRWNSNQTGAVGKFELSDLQDLLGTIAQELGISLHAKQVLEPFIRAYQQGENLAEATRLLVHELFQGYPLIVIDGDDPLLKKSFTPAVEFELFGKGSQPFVESTLETWNLLNFNAQVPGRSINLFYLTPGIRERIERTDNGFAVVNTSIRFSEEEMKQEIHNHPERFSPNVILRPVYQEMILPNLSYVGGGAEVAYWLQLKQVFQELGVFFPQIMLRDGFVVFSQTVSRKIAQENIKPEEVFMDCDDYLKAHVLSEKQTDQFFQSKQNKIEAIYTSVIERMKKEDATLEASARASLAKQLNGLKSLEKKLIRAEKRNEEILTNRLFAIREEAMPNGKVQERYFNIVQMLLEFGNKDFLEEIYTHCDAFDTRFKMITT